MKTNLLDEEKLKEAAKNYNRFEYTCPVTGAYDSFIKGAHYAAEELEKKLPRWIPVKEWNEEFTVCIFRSKDGKRFIGHLETIEGKQAICTDLGYALESDLGVTHCMPLYSLPEPPKEKEE